MPHQFMSVSCKKCKEFFCPVCTDNKCPKCEEIDVADENTMRMRKQMRQHMDRNKNIS